MNVLVRITATIVTGAAFALAAAPAASSQHVPSSVTIEDQGAFAGNGVLISDPASPFASRYVLTTAEIVSHFTTPANVRVIAGLCDVSDLTGTQAADVTTWVTAGISPPLPPNYPDDIALLTLATPIVYGGPHIQPARLPYDDSNDYAGESATVAGFWSDFTSPCIFAMPLTCLNLTMEVLTTAAAQAMMNSLPTPPTVSNDQLCVLDPFLTKTVLTRGSGAGVYVEGCSGESVLVGLGSFGDCADASLPYVTTRVSSYLGWINYERGMPATANPGSTMGTTSCTPCGCSCMLLSSNGQLPKIPNPAFELRITGMPDLFSGPAAMLYINAGSMTQGVTKWCGKFYVPFGGIFQSLGSGVSVLKSSCQHEMYWKLPLPASLSFAAGIPLTAQAVVFCDDGIGLTNAWEFKLMN